MYSFAHNKIMCTNEEEFVGCADEGENKLWEHMTLVNQWNPSQYKLGENTRKSGTNNVQTKMHLQSLDEVEATANAISMEVIHFGYYDASQNNVTTYIMTNYVSLMCLVCFSSIWESPKESDQLDCGVCMHD